MQDVTRLGGVPIPLLTGENYATWSFAVQSVLMSMGLWSAVVGGGAETRAVAGAKAEDRMKALGIIRCAVSPMYYADLRDVEAPERAWEVLKERCTSKSEAAKLRLLSEWQEVKLGYSEKVTAYIGRVKALRQQLIDAGEDISEDRLVRTLLSGLPSRYAMLAVAFRVAEKVDLAKLEQELLNVEKADEQPTGYPAGYTTAAASYAPSGKCFACGERGHLAAKCPNRSERKRDEREEKKPQEKKGKGKGKGKWAEESTTAAVDFDAGIILLN